LSEKLGLIN